MVISKSELYREYMRYFGKEVLGKKVMIDGCELLCFEETLLLQDKRSGNEKDHYTATFDSMTGEKLWEAGEGDEKFVNALDNIFEINGIRISCPYCPKFGTCKEFELDRAELDIEKMMKRFERNGVIVKEG